MVEQTEASRTGGTRIFVSYRRDDTSGYAGRLSDDLRDRFPGRVFRDIDTIGPGADFHDAIDEAVGSCDALVAVIGRGWLTSQDRGGRRRLDDPEDFVRLEIAAALERNILVMPVLVDNATMPAAADLPEQLVSLARRNATEVSDSRWDYDVGRLLVRLESLKPQVPQAGEEIGAGPVETRSPAPPAAPPGARKPPAWSAFLRRWKWAALGLAVALVAVVGTAVLLSGSSDDGVSQGPAKLAQPSGVAAGDGYVAVADSANNRVVKVTSGGDISVVAGAGDPGSDRDGGPATSAKVEQPGAIASGAAGNLYLSEKYRGGIRKVGPDGLITTVPAHSPGVASPRFQAMTVGPGGNLLVATDREVLRVSPDGTLVSVAGTADKGFGGDGGPATSAKLDSPYGLAVDGAGNIFVADTGNSRIRKIRTDGTIVTVAGTGKQTASGDGGPAVDANLYSPMGIAFDAKGALYVGGSNQVRKIGPEGVIVTVAGSPENTSGFAGDDGPARAALLDEVVALALDPGGNVYVSDYGNSRVRRIENDGTIRTIA